MTEQSIPSGAYIGHVHLKVADLDRSIRFYHDLLGFDVVQNLGSAAFLSAGGYHHHLGLNTWESRKGSPPPQGTTGLYHFAINYPTRQDLAIAVKRLLEGRWSMDGMSDHLTHEALYLHDPDFNGIELAWDRDPSAWRDENGNLTVGSFPLDYEGLLAEAADGVNWPSGSAPAGTRIGHVHLKVSDVERAVHFYRDLLGFDLIGNFGPGAAFLSAGGYHHHLGLNTWESRNGSPPPQGTTGLYHFAINYPERRDLGAAAGRLLDHGWGIDGLNDHGTHMALYLHDPDTNGIELAWDRERGEWPRRTDGGINLATGKAFDLQALIAESRAPAASS